jgi:SAM-dependent methyltransferase
MVSITEPQAAPAESPTPLKQSETELLLAVAEPVPSASRIRELLRLNIDWSYVLLAGHRHALLPLLHTALNQHPDLVPDSISRQIREYFHANEQRNSRVLREAAGVMAELQDAEIDALSMRVLFLLAQSYDPGEREYEPLDVLVAPAGVRRALAVLANRGYRPVHKLSPGREALLLHSRPLPLQHDESLLRVHLQDRVTPTFYSVQLTLSDLVERPARGAADSLLEPAPEDVLLLCCIYGTFHIWGKLAWVGDVARVIAQTPDLDWQRLLRLARDCGAERPLRLGLYLTQDLLDVKLPEDISRAIEDDAVVQEMGAGVHRRLFHDLRGRLTEHERARFRLRTRDRLLDKLRYCVNFAVTPTPEDWNDIRLPDPLTAAFYVLRPPRLVLEQLRPRPERAPYFSTPLPLVKQMLALAEIGPEDVVYDLGCGDGRIVIEAARSRGSRGVGIDIDPQRVAEARENARAAGVEHLVSFVEGDVLKADMSSATVVTVWMLQTLNIQLRPKLRSELAAGARIVSHSFDMGDWLPSKTEIVQIGEDSVVNCLWTIGDAGERPAPEPEPRIAGVR